MTEHRYAELLSLRLHCAGPDCGQSFQKAIAQLAGRSAVTCPRCNKPVELREHARAISDFMTLAAELERVPQGSV